MVGRIQRRVALILLASSALCGTAGAQSTLEQLSYSSGSGGAVDVIMQLSGGMPDAQVFTTDNPARIAVDLPNTQSALERRTLTVGAGATRSVTAVEAGGRTRVVIDLFRSVEYEERVEGDRYIIAVKGGGGGAVSKASSNSGLGSIVSDQGSGDAEISAIDFRRGSEGEGRVIIDFGGSGANVDLTREGSTLYANIYNSKLPSGLEQQLDVIDFATPVQTITSYNDGNRVRIEVNAAGNFEHLAYQTGSRYVLEVKEFVEPEVTPEELLLEPPDYDGQPVTFTFQDIEVRTVLQLMADISGNNIVVADSVSGSITLRLQDVPWDQALDLILQAKSLDKRQVGNVIWIAPAEEIAAREQQQLAALAEKRRLEPLQSTFVQVNYAKAVDLAGIIQSTQSADGGGGASGLLSARGSVTVDERTNVLLVTDTQDRLDAIRSLVTLLDRPVRQVQIESRIVVASDSFSDELGVRFGVSGAYEDSNGNLASTGGNLLATDRLTNTGLFNRLNNVNQGSALPVFEPSPTIGGLTATPPLLERLNVNLPASGNAARWGLAILGADYLLDLELSALEQEGRGEVVSSPRLITANQKESFISQGVEIPFLEAASSGAASVQFKEAVLELRVQPLITPDNRVILDLAVKNDAIGELVPSQAGTSIPSIDTREIETQVLVDSGQTVVLGGIFERIRRYDSSKVPVRGDIPGLGALFRNKSQQDDKAELLIFVTPTILSENIGAN